MIPTWVPYVLTISQAMYLVGALPRPQAHGLYGPESDPECSESGSDPPEILVIGSPYYTNTLSARQTPAASSYTDANTSTYTSAITVVQPDRPLTVVTSTALSSTQVPTTTSAAQISPDTTGVRAIIGGGRHVH